MSRRHLVAVWSSAAIVAGVVTVALALLSGGGAPPPAPPGLDDAGRLPAWIGAIVTFVALIIGVVAVGLGLVGSGALDHPRPRAHSAAAATAALWAAVTVLQIGLLAWELRGRAEVFDSSRAHALLLQLGFVVVSAACWMVSARVQASIAGLAAALAGLLPVVLAGHPRSADNPVLAGVSVSLHVVSAATWVGGLAALGWLAATDGRDWAGALRRYSQLALVCVVALTVSGIVTTALRLGSPSQLLTSRYGAIVLFKIVLLAGLVAAGWLQRQYVFRRSPITRRHFLPVAGYELIMMTVTLALASALARTPPPS